MEGRDGAVVAKVLGCWFGLVGVRRTGEGPLPLDPCSRFLSRRCWWGVSGGLLGARFEESKDWSTDSRSPEKRPAGEDAPKESVGAYMRFQLGTLVDDASCDFALARAALLCPSLSCPVLFTTIHLNVLLS